MARAFDPGLSANADNRIDLSNLIDSNSKQNLKQQQQNHLLSKLKPVKTKGLSLGSKRTYSEASAFCYNAQKRPFSSLSALSERFNQKRFKTYAPRNGEVPLWSEEELDKYYDIERMCVHINEQAYIACGYQIKPKDYRTVVRKVDDDGRFKWINIELREIAREYSKDIDEIFQIFE